MKSLPIFLALLAATSLISACAQTSAQPGNNKLRKTYVETFSERPWGYDPGNAPPKPGEYDDLWKYPIAIVQVDKIIDLGSANSKPILMEVTMVERLYNGDQIPDKLEIAIPSTGYGGCGMEAPLLKQPPAVGARILVSLNKINNPPVQFAFSWQIANKENRLNALNQAKIYRNHDAKPKKIEDDGILPVIPGKFN